MSSGLILSIALLAPQRVRIGDAPAVPNVERTPPEVAYYADPIGDGQQVFTGWTSISEKDGSFTWPRPISNP